MSDESGKVYNKIECKTKSLENGDTVYTYFQGTVTLSEYCHNKHGKLVSYISHRSNMSMHYYYKNEKQIRLVGFPIPQNPNKDWVLDTEANTYTINL